MAFYKCGSSRGTLNVTTHKFNKKLSAYSNSCTFDLSNIVDSGDTLVLWKNIFPVLTNGVYLYNGTNPQTNAYPSYSLSGTNLTVQGNSSFSHGIVPYGSNGGTAYLTVYYVHK
mgnify:CR=1 FL=1